MHHALRWQQQRQSSQCDNADSDVHAVRMSLTSPPFFVVAVLIVGCGARTGLNAPDTLDATIDRQVDSNVDSSGEDGSAQPINCSLHYGPVSSCDGEGAPWILRCVDTAVCADVFSNYGPDGGEVFLWGCCTPDLKACVFADPDVGHGCPCPVSCDGGH